MAVYFFKFIFYIFTLDQNCEIKTASCNILI